VRVVLVTSVDPNEVKATFHQGVLEVRLRKTPSSRSKLIEVSTS